MISDNTFISFVLAYFNWLEFKPIKYFRIGTDFFGFSQNVFPIRFKENVGEINKFKYTDDRKITYNNTDAVSCFN